LAVKIRLKKMGSKKRPFYRLIVADSRSPRDGRFLETLGHYNPMVEPAEIKIDEDKVYKWLDNGAKPTVNAANLLKAQGILERWRLLKSGVTIAELDAKIEERRAKQPKAQPKEKKKLSKKAIAAAKVAEEEAAKPEESPEEVDTPAEPSVEEAPADTKPAEDAPAEEAPAEEAPAKDKPAQDAPAEEASAKDKPAQEASAEEAEAPAEESGEEKKS
jgi:small subunit ribosomal protein S16